MVGRHGDGQSSKLSAPVPVPASRRSRRLLPPPVCPPLGVPRVLPRVPAGVVGQLPVEDHLLAGKRASPSLGERHGDRLANRLQNQDPTLINMARRVAHARPRPLRTAHQATDLAPRASWRPTWRPGPGHAFPWLAAIGHQGSGPAPLPFPALRAATGLVIQVWRHRQNPPNSTGETASPKWLAGGPTGACP